jgi:hypothetical protein
MGTCKMITETVKRVRYPETAESLSWDQLVALEPRLRAMMREARRLTDLCSLCRWFGYHQRGGGLKAEMERLVGWYCDHPDPIVRSSAAYDVAFEAIYDRGVPAQHEPCSYSGGIG